MAITVSHVGTELGKRAPALVKLAVAAWATVSLEPLLAVLFPDWWELARYLVSALVCALVIELVLVTLVGRPRIELLWNESGSTEPIDRISAVVSQRRPNVHMHTVKLNVSPSSLLGLAALRRWSRWGVGIDIVIERAPLRPFVDDSSLVDHYTRGDSSKAREDAVRAVVEIDEHHGFRITPGLAPKEAGSWRWADVTWELDGPLTEDDYFSVDYRWHHEKRVLRALSWVLVKRTSNVHSLRLQRK